MGSKYEEKIKKIFEELFHIKMKDNLKDVNLFGKPFYLYPIDLVLLYVTIIDRYTCNINKKKLLDDGFSTFNKILLTLED